MIQFYCGNDCTGYKGISTYCELFESLVFNITVDMVVVLGKLGVPLSVSVCRFFLIWLHFFLKKARLIMVSIKCILCKLAQKLSAFSFALEPREYKLLVIGDSFQIAPINSFCCRHGQSSSDRDSGEFGFS